MSSSAPEPSSPADAFGLLELYADGADRDRELIALLKDERGKTSVRAAGVRLLNAFRTRRAEAQDRWNRLTVMGRAQTPAEEEWLAKTGPKEINRLDGRIRRLETFLRRHFPNFTEGPRP